MKELEEMKKSFDKFMAKAEQTLLRIKGTAPKQILDKKEKEWLETIIKPFRSRENIQIIKKTYYHSYEAFIQIWINGENIDFPFFRTDTMYKGMKLYKEYTLDKLGLFKE